MRKTISIGQISALLTVILGHRTRLARILDRAQVISILLSGSDPRQWT